MKQKIMEICESVIADDELDTQNSKNIEAAHAIPCLWISTQQTEYKLYLHKLRYIETNNRQLVIHYGNELIPYNGKLLDFQRYLPDTFFRCNNSYIVNIDYIERIQKDINRYTIHLISGEQLPLSRDKKNALKNKWRL